MELNENVKRHTGLDVFGVDPDTQTVLGRLAAAKDVSMSYIVREALTDYAAKPEVAAAIAEYRERQERIEAAKAISQV